MRYRTPLAALVLCCSACGACSEPAASPDGVEGDAEEPRSGASSAPEDVDTSLHSYEANDARILFNGRINRFDPKAPTFSTGATSVTVRFSGEAISVRMADEFKWGNSRNWLDVYVDGEFTKKFAAERDVSSYELVSGLTPGEHTLVLYKRTQPGVGRVSILGFEVSGTLLEPPARPNRRIELVGDSISAGEGAEAANNSPQCSEDAWNQAGGWGQPYHNANAAFGAVAARALGAEYRSMGISGIGLVRNYSSQYDARPMPEVYELLYPEDEASAEYDTSEYEPHVLVLALGTNDFSPGDNPPEDPRPNMDVGVWVEAYVAFANRLRDLYPEAHLLLASSPMLGDGWPDADDRFRSDQLEGIAQVQAQLSEAGDARVHSFLVDKVAGAGCGTHPGTEEHQELGLALAARITEITGWE